MRFCGSMICARGGLSRWPVGPRSPQGWLAMTDNDATLGRGRVDESGRSGAAGSASVGVRMAADRRRQSQRRSTCQFWPGGTRAALVLLWALMGPSGLAQGGAPAKPKQILILYSSRDAARINLQWDRGIRRELGWHLPEPVTIGSATLDCERLSQPRFRGDWLKLVRGKYGASGPDVVILVHDSAARAFLQHCRDFFPRAAVVLCTVSQTMYDRLAKIPRMTGVLYRGAFQGIVEVARSLVPAMRHIVVVGGAGRTDRVALDGAQAALVQRPSLDFTYWMGLPAARLCAQAAKLPADTVLLYLGQDRDREGGWESASGDLVRRLSAAAGVPVFGLCETVMGQGVVGCCFLGAEEQGMRAGEIAARIVQGADPGSIPLVVTEIDHYVFDGGQLQRWAIPDRALPHGSLIEAHEPTVWEAYWPYITAGVSVTLLQSLLIGSLLVNRRKRSQAEHALADRLRFEAMLSQFSSRFVHVAPEDLPGELEQALAQITEHLGLDRGTIYELSSEGDQLRAIASWAGAGQAAPPAVISRDLIPGLWTKLNQDGLVLVSSPAELPEDAVHEREYFARRGLKALVAVPISSQGTVFGALSFAQVTRQRPWNQTVLIRLKLISEVIANALAQARADAALSASRNEARQLAGRLLTAQEDERKRLAREMHDDISQRLASTAIEAGKVEQHLPPCDVSRETIAGLKAELIVLSDDVHRISRQLHPAILDDLGLEDAIRSECHRLAERETMVVDYHAGRLPDSLPKDAALCLYRIAQEALRNIAKHSRTDRVEITLNADLEFVNLEVRDFGCGFDPVSARGQPGLGLASMEERVRLVGGEIDVRSAPGQGTCIGVRIPLVEDEA